MATKKRKKAPYLLSRGGDAWKKMSSMRYIDLQRNALVRGMDFSQMVNSDLYGLQSWLSANWDKQLDPSLLDQFDYWREKFLYGRGYVGEPFVRLGYLGKTSEDGETLGQRRKISGIRKPKRKRKEKNADGIFIGTKKELTFKWAKQGKPIDEVITIVLEKFPEASEKSIKIWYRQSLKP